MKNTNLSLHQTLIAVAALIGITLLGIFDKVDGQALIAIYAAVIGGALGYVNGKKAGGQ